MTEEEAKPKRKGNITEFNRNLDDMYKKTKFGVYCQKDINVNIETLYSFLFNLLKHKGI